MLPVRAVALLVLSCALACGPRLSEVGDVQYAVLHIEPQPDGTAARPWLLDRPEVPLVALTVLAHRSTAQTLEEQREEARAEQGCPALDALEVRLGEAPMVSEPLRQGHIWGGEELFLCSARYSVTGADAASGRTEISVRDAERARSLDVPFLSRRSGLALLGVESVDDSSAARSRIRFGLGSGAWPQAKVSLAQYSPDYQGWVEVAEWSGDTGTIEPTNEGFDVRTSVRGAVRCLVQVNVTGLDCGDADMPCAGTSLAVGEFELVLP